MSDTPVVMDNSGQPAIERARIEVEAVRKGITRTTWCFTLRDEWGQGLLRSSEFVSATDHPTNQKRERNALQNMLIDIRNAGWTIAHAPNLKERNNWRTYQFVRGSHVAVVRDIEFMKAMTGGGHSGLPRGTWTMWTITIAVIIGLFLLCVALVLTAEVRVSPAAITVLLQT